MKFIKATLVFFLAALLLTSCASSRAGGKGCGCAAKKGMVGY